MLVMDVPEDSSVTLTVQDCVRKLMHFRSIQTPLVRLAEAGTDLIPAEVTAGTIPTIWPPELLISLLKDLLYHHQLAVPQRMLRRQYRESKPLDRLNLVP